jgi:hypothetical protein
MIELPMRSAREAASLTTSFALQAAFSAINVEPEENLDEEIDTTKDLQVRRASDFVVPWWCAALTARPF